MDRKFDNNLLMYSAFNHCAEVIVIINENGDIVEVNERVQDLFGYSVEEVINEPLSILFPNEYKEGHKAHIKHFFSRPQIRPMGQ